MIKNEQKKDKFFIDVFLVIYFEKIFSTDS